MFVYIRSSAFVIVVTQKLVLQQSKNVTTKCTENLPPAPLLVFYSSCKEPWNKEEENPRTVSEVSPFVGNPVSSCLTKWRSNLFGLVWSRNGSITAGYLLQPPHPRAQEHEHLMKRDTELDHYIKRDIEQEHLLKRDDIEIQSRSLVICHSPVIIRTLF